MPVKIIIRENGKQCMMQMPVKTTLRLYCDDSRLVFKCIQRHQCIATQLPCYYSFVHKNVIVKLREICMETGSTSSATKVIARYTRERGSPEANSGLSTSNLLLSYLILGTDDVSPLLSGEPDYFGRNKISSGGDLSHYSSASLY